MQRLKLALAAFVSALFVVWLLWPRDELLLRQAQHLVSVWLPLAVAGLLLSHMLRGLRLYDEFRSELGWRYRDALALSLQHTAWVSVLPMRTGDAALPLLLKRGWGVDLVRATAVLAWLRWQDLVFIVGVLLLVFPGLPPWSRGLGLLGLALLLLALPRVFVAWSVGADEATARWHQRIAAALSHSVRAARRGWLWTAGSWTVKLSAQALVLALLLPIDLKAGAMGVLGAEAAGLSPLQGLAGLGSYEAGAALSLALYGVPLTDGLKAAFLLHMLGLALTVAYAWLAWLLVHPPHPPHTSEPAPGVAPIALATALTDRKE